MGKRYIPPETKRRALELVAGGMSMADAAAELGMSATSIYPWKRDAVLTGEWDRMVEKAHFERKSADAQERAGGADHPAQEDEPQAQPKAEALTRYRQPDSPQGSPFLGFGWSPSDTPEPPTPSTPMSVMTVVEPCAVCGKLTPPAEMGAGRKMGVCPACLALLRGLLGRERKKQSKGV